MFEQLKKIKRSLGERIKISFAYKNDCREYAKWQYNNPNLRTKNSLEARILRQTHIIEKGMSLSHPRAKFGVEKAKDLLDYIEDFHRQGFAIGESTPVINALGVIDAYLKFHRERGFVPSEIVKKYENFKYYTPDGCGYGIHSIPIEKLEERIKGNFQDFFCSRHSVRQFLDKRVSLEDIKNAVALAIHAPSACNRQSVKVYFYEGKEINDSLGNLIAGNTGFEKETPHYLVLTSDISSYYNAAERNQMYVDGGIFCMGLIESLHYFGIASCVLQNGEFKDQNLKFKKICGNIPDNEKIICFIAIGYYKDSVVYATSHRKTLEEVLIIK